MVSTAALTSFPHKIGLFVALLITLITDAFAIAYVIETRKRCVMSQQRSSQVIKQQGLQRNDNLNLGYRESPSDLGWTLIALAIADIILATIICGLTEFTHLLP